MAKKLTLICLFLVAAVGVKAQQTICYHFYKCVDPATSISNTIDLYIYFHFNGIYCYWTFDRNDEYQDNSNRLFRYLTTTHDNCDLYIGGHMDRFPSKYTQSPDSYGIVRRGEWGYQFYDGFTSLCGDNGCRLNGDFLVSKDKTTINWYNKVLIITINNTSLFKKTLVGKMVSEPPKKTLKPSMIE